MITVNFKNLYIKMYNCKYCGKECKNNNSLIQHEIRCKLNENKKYDRLYRSKNGDILNITILELNNYRKDHNVCEICGKTINEASKWNSKFAPKNLCVDHDHNTLKFRGLLCSVCNRQLGWYEKYKDEINTYLNK